MPGSSAVCGGAAHLQAKHSKARPSTAKRSPMPRSWTRRRRRPSTMTAASPPKRSARRSAACQSLRQLRRSRSASATSRNASASTALPRCSPTFSNPRPHAPGNTRTGAGGSHVKSGALGHGSQVANGIVTFNQFWCYFTPLIGAYIADAYLGRFNHLRRIDHHSRGAHAAGHRGPARRARQRERRHGLLCDSRHCDGT